MDKEKRDDEFALYVDCRIVMNVASLAFRRTGNDW
jgi:hypothetical protein